MEMARRQAASQAKRWCVNSTEVVGPTRRIRALKSEFSCQVTLFVFQLQLLCDCLCVCCVCCMLHASAGIVLLHLVSFSVTIWRPTCR